MSDKKDNWVYLKDGTKVHISWIDTEFEEVDEEE
jgi:hypothetical protein